MLVKMLQTSLSNAEMNSNIIPKQIIRVEQENAWKVFLMTNGVVIRNSAGFREFIEGPRPAGCATPIHVVRRMVKGTDAEELLERLTRGQPGGDNNPYGCLGRPEEGINRNDITVDSPDIISFPPDAQKAKRKRDYSRESKQGTSVSYTLRRLEKTRPDLLEKVKAGDITPTAAGVMAGFIDRQISVPLDPTKAAKRLLHHFSGDRLLLLIAELTKG